MQEKHPEIAWRQIIATRNGLIHGYLGVDDDILWSILLGWVPFNTGHVRWGNGQLHFNGTAYSVWDSYGLAGFTIRSGSFSEDSRGRWYFNVAVEIETKLSAGKRITGIDLGCKEAATASNAEKLRGRWYRDDEKALATAQRAGKKKQIKKIHARISNRRKEDTHKFTISQVEKNGAIFVGNVSSKAMVKTNMAKSALDAGWYSLKKTLEYKCASAGVLYQEVNEAYSTRTFQGACSECGALSGPKGLNELGMSGPRRGSGAVLSVEARTTAM